ncbi:MAG: DUF2835 domain-containing protein [Gammaproteobacteria bacterium SHHR-1]|uniref:DUF2835 domain-containing protein n=1 Tax=Magnetovirga frankeli TaxID=947516 RepID=UPI00129300B6|nr:DUF2835 domain-containing protein [gamma proteobacterium SS-5]
MNPRRTQQPIRFSLSISGSDFLRYYQGGAVMVSVLAEDLRRIQFPARHLRPFVSEGGIQGRFEMLLDQDNRFISMKRL